jgi:hypothetical protein
MDMVDPSPCPSCQASRVWLGRPSPGDEVSPVSCRVCGRTARACTRCGWEFTGVAGTEPMTVDAAPAGCVSCAALQLVGRRAQPAAARVGGGRTLASRLQRRETSRGQLAADVAERGALSAYRARRTFITVVRDASLRAQARARLEASLQQLEASDPL